MAEGEGEAEEAEVEGERGRKMWKKRRRRRMGGRRRRKGPWVGRLQARGEDEKEEVGEVEMGDGGRGLGERDLGEWREVGQGEGELFVCQLTFEQPMASPDLMLQCDEAVPGAGRSRCSFFGAASLVLHPAPPSSPPYLSLSPPLFLSSGVPSTLPSPSLRRSLRQMGGRRWR